MASTNNGADVSGTANRRNGIRTADSHETHASEKIGSPKSPIGKAKAVASNPSPTRSVKVVLTKPGKRQEHMASIKEENNRAVITTISNITHEEMEKLDVITSLASRLRPKPHYIDDDEEDYIRRPRSSLLPPTSVDDETFFAKSHVDDDFLHHADDMLHMVLELPSGFHPKPVDEETHGKSKMQIDLLGLPGGLQLTPALTKKYFGEGSRYEFFDRYHWLAHQKDIVGRGCAPVRFGDDRGSGGDDNDDGSEDGLTMDGLNIKLAPGEELIFDKEDQLEEYIPFAPRRPRDDLAADSRNSKSNIGIGIGIANISSSNATPDVNSYEESLSAIRQQRRAILAAKKQEKIPTLQDILGSESRVLEAIENNRRVEEAERAAEAAAAVIAEKRRRMQTAAGRRAAAREAARAAHAAGGRIVVPPLAVAPVKLEKVVIPSKSLLDEPLQQKTVDTIVQLHDPKVLVELTKNMKQRLSAMRS